MPELRLGWRREHRRLIGLWLKVGVLAAVFAMVEIQVEGAAGWAANLPTWRIDHHWALDLFWGGRPLTGYHVWVFLFMILVFHLVFFLQGRPSLRLEFRVLGSLSLFWILEDFFWFVLNPAYGLARFTPRDIPWHHHWLVGVPADYVVYVCLSALLFRWSLKSRCPAPSSGEQRCSSGPVP